jgi:sulfite reductase (NADPH) flavoprotein alpha-component
VTELHRSLFLGEGGRLTTGIVSLAMLLMTVSGLWILAQRMGGWRRVFLSARGSALERVHLRAGRLVVAGFILTSLTGVYMSLVNFGYLPDGSDTALSFPPNSSDGPAAPLDTVAALIETPLSDLRELLFPAPDDPSDVFSLTTAAGNGFIDRATGQWLSFTPNSLWQNVYNAIYVLHSGQGVWWFGLLLGAAAAAVPIMAVTGTLIWLRRRSGARVSKCVSANFASDVILVGSEGNTTWSFAETLRAELARRGFAVHVTAMNNLRRHYPRARRLIVLTATYGNGGAPESAKRFFKRLRNLSADEGLKVAVVGFGDRLFPDYCRFASKVLDAFLARGHESLVQYATVDRQSAVDFAAWGRTLGNAIGTELCLEHAEVAPVTGRLTLREREDYGVGSATPVALLRFALHEPSREGRRHLAASLLHFHVGDLLGIIPPGEVNARYYSLASDWSDGFAEICVRRQVGGMCSSFLHSLAAGDKIEAFVRPNPDFRPGHGRKPVLLVGAGTGVAPLVGFIRKNRRRRPMYLFFGARDQHSDYLYRNDLQAARTAGQVVSVSTAFSRTGGGYVQEQLMREAELVRRLLEQGARVVVCGSLDMARGVRDAFDACLAPLGLSVDDLKSKGRYLEDAY